MFIQTRHWAHAAAMVTAMVVGCAMPELDDELDDDDDIVGAEAICEADLDDTACDLCLKTACCDSYTACRTDPDCNCVYGCANAGDSREECEERCHVDTSEFTQAVDLLAGGADACDMQCDEPCGVFRLAGSPEPEGPEGPGDVDATDPL